MKNSTEPYYTPHTPNPNGSEFTTNIPHQLPYFIAEHEVAGVVEWMLGRPKSELADGGLGRTARWVYHYSDDGLMSYVSVEDRMTHDTYVPPFDPEHFNP
jgi:hypothetical protein